MKERNLGLWVDGEPGLGQGGLAEILAQLKGNFDVLKGQIGIQTPQIENGEMSLRSELFRIEPKSSAASNDRWKEALRARVVPDVTQMPEFVRHCRPFSSTAEGPQPALVISNPNPNPNLDAVSTPNPNPSPKPKWWTRRRANGGRWTCR